MTGAAIVKDVPMWQYLAANNGFIGLLQLQLEQGQISQAKYDGAVAGMLQIGRECDQIIADAIAAHPWGFHTPELTPAEAEASAHFFDQEHV